MCCFLLMHGQRTPIASCVSLDRHCWTTQKAGSLIRAMHVVRTHVEQLVCVFWYSVLIGVTVAFPRGRTEQPHATAFLSWLNDQCVFLFFFVARRPCTGFSWVLERENRRGGVHLHRVGLARVIQHGVELAWICVCSFVRSFVGDSFFIGLTTLHKNARAGGVFLHCARR